MNISPERMRNLEEELDANVALFQRQPTIIQRFFEAQTSQISDALIEHKSSLHFSLPDKISKLNTVTGQEEVLQIPMEHRHYAIGGFLSKLTGKDIKDDIRHKIIELEHSQVEGVSLSGQILQYTIATHLVHNVLPSGKNVQYRAEDEDEQIASVPVSDDEPESAITQASDAITEEGLDNKERGELQVPYIPYARKFYLPQWVSLNDDDQLIVGSLKEAEANISSMQQFITILHLASSITSYIIADKVYQNKRYGMLGQLVNQGRAISRFKVRQIITTIKNRARAGQLNRGLSLSIPYFDDQDLILDNLNFEVIPAGRIMFVPAFVVRAAKEEADKRRQDTRFNDSTRKHLLAGLRMLEEAFIS